MTPKKRPGASENKASRSIADAVEKRRSSELAVMNACLTCLGLSKKDHDYCLERVTKVHESVHGRLDRMFDRQVRSIIAADLAASARMSCDPDERERIARLALDIENGCTEAHVILGDLMMEAALEKEKALKKALGIRKDQDGHMTVSDRDLTKEENEEVIQMNAMFFLALNRYGDAIEAGRAAVGAHAVERMEDEGVFVIDEDLYSMSPGAAKRAHKDRVFARMHATDVMDKLDIGPLLRAMIGSAKIKLIIGDLRGAKELFEDVLLHDKKDRFGARYAYRDVLKVLKKTKELTTLYEQYPELKREKSSRQGR